MRITPSVDHPFTGAELRDGGIQVALASAEIRQAGWSEQAYSILESYLKSHLGDFMCETFRAFAEHECELVPPPSNRAYGAIIQRARKEGLIVHAGYSQVSNPKAHRTPASVWIKA